MTDCLQKRTHFHIIIGYHQRWWTSGRERTKLFLPMKWRMGNLELFTWFTANFLVQTWIFSLWPREKVSFQITPSLKSCISTNGHFFARSQASAKEASTELGPTEAPWTIPRGQRPNPKVWRKSRSSVEASHSEGQRGFNGTALLPTNSPADAGMGCPCRNEVFCQHPSDPHQI